MKLSDISNRATTSPTPDAYQRATLPPALAYAETIGAYLFIKDGELWQIPANIDGSPGHLEEASPWMGRDEDDRYIRQNVEDALELLGSGLLFDHLPQCD